MLRGNSHDQILFLLVGLLVVAAAGCDVSSELAEPTQEKEPYWWRSDPFFADKNVDEEATLALGDPDVVIGASEDPDPLQVAYQRIAEKLIELYGEEHVAHIVFYHHEVIQDLEIPDVDMSLIEADLKDPITNETLVGHCECPFDEDNDPECNEGNGGGNGDNPPPPPPPHVEATMQLLVCNGDPGCDPRTLEAKGYIDALKLAQAIQFINFKVTKNGVPVYDPAQYFTSWFRRTSQHRKEFFVSGPKAAWRVSFTGRVTHFPGFPVYIQNEAADDLL